MAPSSPPKGGKKSPEDCYRLAVAFAKGRGVPWDPVRALWQMRKAAQGGLAQAQYAYGVAYQNGEGVKKNLTEAFKWFELAAGQGHPGAQRRLGLMYNEGQGAPLDLALAVQWLRLAAENGDPDARLAMGIMSYAGQGLERDPVEAARWLRLSADPGPPTHKSLGLPEPEVFGAGRDLGLPQRLWILAARRGQIDAASLAALGRGPALPEDLAEADGWLSLALASELGLARLLDGALRRGDGATEAPREPVAKADESGLGPADKGRPAKRTRPDAKEASTLEWLIYALSLALGEGATQDLDEAVGLLRLVAERGEPRAWLALGLVLLKMNGLSVKPNEAVECLKAARASDSLEVGDCFRVLEAAVRAEEDGELARVWASLKLAEVDLSSIEPTEAVPKSTIGAKKPSSSKPGRARAGKAAKAGSVKEGQGRGD